MRTARRIGAPAASPTRRRRSPEGRINLTDPDSKLVQGLRGWIQGYNAQAVTNEHQIVLAAEIMTVSPDFGHLEPMLDAARRELAARRRHRARPTCVLADAGYWHREQMNAITGERHPGADPARLQPTQTTTRPGWDGGAYDFMRRVLATERGGELYRNASR